MVATGGDDALCPTCGTAFPANRTHCANDGTRLVPRRAQAAPLTGRIIATKYLVGPQLGEGMLGAVYVGRQATVDREVAIKVIKPSLVQDPAAAERLFYAAQTACRLSGPAVAIGLDFGRTEDGLVYVVSELVRGRTLATELAELGRLPNYRAVPIAIQLCDALLTAQTSAGIPHGDLKPANIFVADDGRGPLVKVADFGLARALHPDPWALPAGLAQYAAPELGQEGRAVDAQTDLYALGCILYEMVTGRMPHEATSVLAMLSKHLQEEVEAPSKRRPDLRVPPALDHLITSALAKDANARPATMEVFGEQIAAVHAQLPPEQRGGLSSALPVAAPTPSAPMAMPPASALGATAAVNAPPPFTPFGQQPPVAAAPTPFGAPPPYVPTMPPHGVRPAATGGNTGMIIMIAVIVVAVVGIIAFVKLRYNDVDPDDPSTFFHIEPPKPHDDSEAAKQMRDEVLKKVEKDVEKSMDDVEKQQEKLEKDMEKKEDEWDK